LFPLGGGLPSTWPDSSGPFQADSGSLSNFPTEQDRQNSVSVTDVQVVGLPGPVAIPALLGYKLLLALSKSEC